MKLSNQKLQLAMAKACMNAYDLCKAADMQYQTLRRASNGAKCKPATIGKIAKALNCDVTDLLEE